MILTVLLVCLTLPHYPPVPLPVRLALPSFELASAPLPLVVAQQPSGLVRAEL